MKNLTKRLLPLLLLALLLVLSACGAGAPVASAAPPIPAEGEVMTLGEGAKEFSFEITFSDGGTASYLIKTDAATVGEALQSLGLISGEDGAYGLYVTTVGGETVKYEDGGHYWSFYINGDYAATGVDATEVEDGAAYAFRVE